MVTVAIMGVVMTLGAVSFNKFGSSQKIEDTREALLSSLRLARNYAITGQNIGYGGSLAYVTFTIDDGGNVKVYPNDLTTMLYFDKDISPTGTIIGATVFTLRFASYDGKLVDNLGVPVSADVTFTITAGSGMEDPGGSGTVRVSPTGLIE